MSAIFFPSFIQATVSPKRLNMSSITAKGQSLNLDDRSNIDSSVICGVRGRKKTPAIFYHYIFNNTAKKKSKQIKYTYPPDSLFRRYCARETNTHKVTSALHAKESGPPRRCTPLSCRNVKAHSDGKQRWDRCWSGRPSS